MEHRKRNMMQHKAELSTLLRIVIASKKSVSFQDNGSASQNLTKALASEAMEYLRNCDHCEIDVKPEKILTESRLAI
jgi:hypothetical protein